MGWWSYSFGKLLKRAKLSGLRPELEINLHTLILLNDILFFTLNFPDLKEKLLDIKGFQAYIIFLDFAKAYDKVSHKALLMKLKSYGFTGPIHNWLTDF